MSDSQSIVLDSEKDYQRTNLIRGSIFLSISPIISLVIGVFISILINDLIPTTDYSVFTWFTTMNSFFVVVIPFELSGAFGRYIALAKGKKEPEMIASLIKTSSVFGLTLPILAGLVAFLITPLVFSFLGISSLYSPLDLLLFAIGTIAITLSRYGTGMASGLQEFQKIGIAQFVANLTSQIIVIVLLISGWGITALLIKWIIVGLLTTIVIAFLVKGCWSLRGSFHSLRPLLAYSYPAVVSFIFAFTFNEFLVRSLIPVGDELGYYGFAVRMITFVSAFTVGFYSALGPYYARSLGQAGYKGLENELRWTMKLSFFLFIPLLSGAIVISPMVFLLIFPNYYWGYQFFAILMAQLFFFLFQRPYTMILNATAKTQQVLLISIISSVLSGALMALVALLSPPFMLHLVVAGYVSAAFFQSLFSGLYVKRKLHINLSITSVMSLIVISAGIITSAVFIHFLRLPPLIELVIIIGVSTLIFIIPIRVFELVSVNEIQKGMQFLPQRLASPLTKFLISIFVKKSKYP